MQYAKRILEERPVLLILVFAFCLRFPCLFWGAPPQVAGPDDDFHISAALKVFTDPAYYFSGDYPPAYQRVLSILYAPEALYYHRTHPHMPEFPRAWHHYAARAVSLACDLLTVYFIFLLAMVAGMGRRIALLASLFYAVSFLPFQYATYAVPETMNALGMVAAVYAFLRALQNPDSMQRLLFAGLVAGAAISVKLALPLYGFLFLLLCLYPGAGVKVKIKQGIVVFLASLLAITSIFPGFFSALIKFGANAISVAGTHAYGPSLGCEGTSWDFIFGSKRIVHEVYGYRSLSKSLSLPMLLLAFAGCVIALRKSRVFWIPAVLFIAVTVYFAGVSQIVRYALPAYPFMILLAVLACEAFIVRTRPFIAALAVTSVLLFSMNLTAREFLSRTGSDTRIEAGKFLREHAADSAIVYFTGHFWSNPIMDFPHRKIPLEFDQFHPAHDRAKPFSWFLENGGRYVVLNSFMTGFHTNALTKKYYPETAASFRTLYETVERECDLVAEFKRGPFENGPDIRIFRTRLAGGS
ncbi:MAG: hypothetical protein A2268_05555 [Candidatus Raymondbacteria bacterium RifOxyA12_full_50_37]|uniref:ArnT-like N-terminal domain-containing protein n=1 Tax=Candidatus Raymondbacteria bacterium RIFOXYD12_FULL_49_13 TaxID=1817890 RepID=A0A1F7FBQ4_UNCRA|nr:MAG: hypothetical protein A2268_05555 [Candidatus Raymondbacteria bacterium RifOxyA12_full_50_37]OGJ89030.1 MAG: hypothetical protein A2248_02790 [Candidatus Raymondbacteria bacterium RIFOXYA2_FULL_49_16]OGJ93793.1 MAG: hypothetical protein A2350_06530 [Candidatus Raymondbacteria bacterium RifOxyB12_full_50_8]OGJ97057.1 MAG: hypothetical protein A2453_04205 [Candidatus Raymondbacteria bacterium RIFOXYC2_FULL_50_21]OGK02743.1 MAG: hypothetical protein A2487_01050 [Candidatus Raymondbacteria b